jgi:hypothetical protein
MVIGIICTREYANNEIEITSVMITTTLVCTVLQSIVINDHRGHAVGVCQLNNEIENIYFGL